MTKSILPTSGTVLGAIVDDLDLRLPEVISKSAREYFASRRPIIKDETRVGVVAAIAQALIDQVYVPDFGALPPPAPDSGTADAIAKVIGVWAYQWDDLVGHLQSEGLGDVPREIAAMACLRLLVVDTALRAAAAVRLANGRPTNCQCELCRLGTVVVPQWPQFGGQRLSIHSIMNQLGTNTLEEFAHLLGVADSTIDGWLRSENPSRVSETAIDLISTALAMRASNRDAVRSAWRIELRWCVALGRIANRLERLVGRSRVIDLGFRLKRYFIGSAEFLRRSNSADEEFRESQLFTLVFGVRAPGVPSVLNTLAKNEPDDAWRSAIQAAQGNWLTYITTVIANERAKARVAYVLQKEVGLGPASAEMLTEIVDQLSSMSLPPALLTTLFAKSDALVMLAIAAHKKGDLPGAAVYLQGAVEHDPERPELHQDLGAHLGQLGRFDEGIAECRRALQLRPGWSIPQVQIGIMLLDAHRDAEALDHLEGLVDRIDWSITFGHTLGNARMRAQQFAAAIEALERVLGEDACHGLALDAAAHCYLMLGDWQRGRELAKRAHAVGHHVTFAKLQANQYKRRR